MIISGIDQSETKKFVRRIERHQKMQERNLIHGEPQDRPCGISSKTTEEESCVVSTS